MSLQKLLKSRRIEARPPTPQEVAKLLESAGHYLKNADVPGLETTARFFLAYPAALDLATLVLRASGYRCKSGTPGHHENTFDALGDLFGPEGPGLSKYLQKCRKKRNEVSYDNWIDMTDTDTDAFLKELATFRDKVANG